MEYLKRSARPPILGWYLPAFARNGRLKSKKKIRHRSLACIIIISLYKLHYTTTLWCSLLFTVAQAAGGVIAL